IEGSQIMARAGYDPRDMANMFRTIEQQGGPGGPQWLSDHPNPGNRYAYITKEAESLHVQNTVPDSGHFQSVQARLHQMSPAPTTTNDPKAKGKQERTNVYTTMMRDGNLFYLIGVAPENEFAQYEPVFRKIAGSIQFAR